MENKRLLKALVEKKILTSEAAAKLEKNAAALKKDVESLIYQQNLVDEETLAKVKSEILEIPFKKVDPSRINQEVLKAIPKESVQTYKIIPLEQTEEELVVGMINPDDAAAQNVLRFIAKQKDINLSVYLVTPSAVEGVLRRYSALGDEIQAALKSLSIKPSPIAEQRIIHLEESRAAVTEEAPIIRIVASFLKEAVNVNASDIHIEPQRKQLRVRFRIDGVLQTIQLLPIEIHQPIISRIKVLSNLRLDETRIPQDGRFRTIIFDREIDFRVSTFPTPFGEKTAIRVLDPSVGLKGLDELGLTGRNLEIFKDGLTKPYGMILITGPTGSGKTTTLYAAMQILNNEGVNIVSLEDPVEYSIDGLNQSQIKPEIGYDFASGLRQILRQDPDVIMVGEIRDNETVALAIHAALTGHIVLSTLHTNNAIGVIPRLVDMKAEPFLLPSVLNLMISQRLVPKLCQQCRISEAAPPAVADLIKKTLIAADIRDYKEPYKIYRSPGCPACKNKGVVGRIAVFEVFQMTPELADIIAGGITESKILAEAKRQGMLTMRQDGILKALEGFVPIEVVLKETEEL